MTALTQKRLFCFGYGYCAEHLGRILPGWRIAGTVREKEKRAILRGRGIEAYIFSPDKPLGDPAAFFEGTTHLLLSIPPGDDGDPAFMHHARDLLEIPTLEWVGYLSSTSVYGDREGGWVDENSELNPNSQRASRRAKAESQWINMQRGRNLPVHIFRLAGIYGPGRSALDAVRAGTARRIEKEGQAFSRIHVDDIAKTLLASMNRPRPGAIYNLCDDEAAPSHEVIAYACALLGKEPPPLIPYEQSDMAPMARSFYSDNRRVRNDLIKSELGVDLEYPDYRAGLYACLEAEEKPASSLKRAST